MTGRLALRKEARERERGARGYFGSCFDLFFPLTPAQPTGSGGRAPRARFRGICCSARRLLVPRVCLRAVPAWSPSKCHSAVLNLTFRWYSVTDVQSKSCRTRRILQFCETHSSRHILVALPPALTQRKAGAVSSRYYRQKLNHTKCKASTGPLLNATEL